MAAKQDTPREGPPNEPYSVFSRTQKIAIVGITVLSTAILTALPINIYYPAMSAMKKDLDTTTEKINLSVTVYIIMQAVAPTFWGPLADRTGRRPMYLIAIIVYIGSCVGLALAPTYSVLLVMRVLQSFGGSPTVAIGSGIIGDVSTPATRGTYFGVMSSVRQVITTTAPFIGGAISQSLSWRWIWWIMVISGGAMFVLMFFFVPETLRSLVGNGSGYANPTPMQWWRHRRYQRQQRQQQQLPTAAEAQASTSVPEVASSTSSTIPPPSPQKRAMNHVDQLKPLTFLLERDVACALVFHGINFGAYQSMLVATSSILSDTYGLSVMHVGMCFMAAGGGSLLSALVTGRVLDFEFRRMSLQRARLAEVSGTDVVVAPKRGYIPSDFPIYKARLRVSIYATLLMEAFLVAYGWCVYTLQPLPILLVILFLVSFAQTDVFNSIQTLTVDLFPADSSSITASNNLIRCGMGAIGTAAIEPGIQAIGVQWMFFTIAMIMVVSNILPVLLFKYGVKWRCQRLEKEANAAEEHAHASVE